MACYGKWIPSERVRGKGGNTHAVTFLWTGRFCLWKRLSSLEMLFSKSFLLERLKKMMLAVTFLSVCIFAKQGFYS